MLYPLIQGFYLVSFCFKSKLTFSFSIHSASEDFIVRMDREFEMMVTPLVFNVCLKLNTEGN